jgi:acyl-CoA hydrolase
VWRIASSEFRFDLCSCEREDLAKSFFTNHFFVGANARENVRSGNGSYVPVFLSEIPKLFREGYMTPDIALLNLSPPDSHGFCSLGVEVHTTRSTIDH